MYDLQKIDQDYTAAQTLSEKLVLEALYKGIISIEFYNDKQHLIYRGEVSIKGLNTKENVVLVVPYQIENKPDTIRLSY